MTLLERAASKLADVPAQTPIEVIKGVSLRATKKGLTVLRLHYSAIPDRDRDTPKGAAWYEKEKKNYASDAMWNKEQEIDSNATGGEAVFGRILSEFYEIVVISDPHWHPDPRWAVVGAFDHGVTNATCLLKGYVPRETIDPVTGKKNPPELYICGEYYSYRREGWANTVEQNCAVVMRGGRDLDGKLVDQMDSPIDPMPDLDRARWIKADPAIFYDAQVQEKGKPTNVYQTYKKNQFFPMTAYTGNRSDVAFVEWLISDYWKGIAQGKKPRLYIVCRNPSNRPQPGLHPYDCPNLLWEMKRAKRVQLTARQLQTRNPSESLQDRDNHALDALKELTGTLRNPTEIPFQEVIDADLKKVTDPNTKVFRARFLMSQAAMMGKIGPDGKVTNKSAPVIDLRRGRGVVG